MGTKKLIKDIMQLVHERNGVVQMLRDQRDRDLINELSEVQRELDENRRLFDERVADHVRVREEQAKAVLRDAESMVAEVRLALGAKPFDCNAEGTIAIAERLVADLSTSRQDLRAAHEMLDAAGIDSPDNTVADRVAMLAACHDEGERLRKQGLADFLELRAQRDRLLADLKKESDAHAETCEVLDRVTRERDAALANANVVAHSLTHTVDELDVVLERASSAEERANAAEQEVSSLRDRLRIAECEGFRLSGLEQAIRATCGILGATSILDFEPAARRVVAERDNELALANGARAERDAERAAHAQTFKDMDRVIRERDAACSNYNVARTVLHPDLPPVPGHEWRPGNLTWHLYPIGETSPRRFVGYVQSDGYMWHLTQSAALDTPVAAASRLAEIVTSGT